MNIKKEDLVAVINEYKELAKIQLCELCDKFSYLIDLDIEEIGYKIQSLTNSIGYLNDILSFVQEDGKECEEILEFYNNQIPDHVDDVRHFLREEAGISNNDLLKCEPEYDEKEIKSIFQTSLALILDMMQRL